MNQIIKVLAFAVVTVYLTGCVAVGHYVVSNPDIYLSEREFINVDPEEAGFSKEMFCSNKTNQCIPYLSALPYQASDYPEDGAIRYTLHASGNGVENSISHRLTPDTFNRFKGTAVLLHGYGGNKEIMLVAAMYFRALGMNVIVPDLFGHGESPERFAVAAKEHTIINELLTELEQTNTTPVIAVGHSMGALPASKLLASQYIDGAILLAPMMRFDLAAKQYLPHKSSFMNDIFAPHLDEIITVTMEDADVTLQQTDLLSSITATTKPVLIINSDIDIVSPPEYFAHLTSSNIEKEVFNARIHASLMLFDAKDALIIEDWLTRKNNK